MADKLRAAVIGQGRSGYSIHVHSMSLLPELYEIAAVADPIQERVDEAVEQTGCAGYTDYKEMLAAGGFDFVVNASPSHLHVPVSLEIMDAGFDVLCDKPLARYVSEVDKLIAKRDETGKRIAVFQQSRFAPYFSKVREVIDSGVLGRVVMIKIVFNGYARRWDWQTLQEFYGGNLLNTGPHPLDQALQLFGESEDPAVWCKMDRVNTFGDAEDHVKLLLSGAKSPTIDIEISSACAYPQYLYQVYGSRGGLAGTMDKIDWKHFDPAEAPERKLIREPLDGRQYCREELPWKEESWSLPEEEANLFDVIGKRYYRDLYKGFAEGGEMEVSIGQVRRQVAVIEECHRQNPL